MTTSINIQCIPTPEIWHPQTATVHGLADEDGKVLTDESGYQIQPD